MDLCLSAKIPHLDIRFHCDSPWSEHFVFLVQSKLIHRLVDRMLLQLFWYSLHPNDKYLNADRQNRGQKTSWTPEIHLWFISFSRIPKKWWDSEKGKSWVFSSREHERSHSSLLGENNESQLLETSNLNMENKRIYWNEGNYWYT